ncbi:hypothetical protein FF011L_02130 [Roseimaritima multifibrata]|uniref:BON domain protein n=1 Tax=Roseimaritima multifibrata TaxID=1930274 RepID=A0A517M9B2_9BACT|nr:BON domain-containing protein [Roseimaritima multifibrata]QDS91483.1 hypothetical protein FF011L_02130 [Roseimaritima multifibrata]
MVDVIARHVDTESEAQALLDNSPINELRDLRIECDQESLLISGRVCCFYHKQVAQETIRNVADGLRVVNSVLVD